MSDWIDKFRLGKSAFIKRDLRLLPLTEAEFEADFFLDRESSSKRKERWLGMVIEREFGAVLAMEDAQLPPPTVNDLATLLAHAMLRPLNSGDRQRPSTISLRDRPQWQELLPHLRQLGIEVVLADDLPWFDEAVVDWMQQTKKILPSADEERIGVLGRGLNTPVKKFRSCWRETRQEHAKLWVSTLPLGHSRRNNPKYRLKLKSGRFPLG